jgi:hypothetical protein
MASTDVAPRIELGFADPSLHTRCTWSEGCEGPFEALQARVGREVSVHGDGSRTLLGLGSAAVTSSPAITTMLTSDSSASPELLVDRPNLLARSTSRPSRQA